MWKTPLGERALKGAEWALFREALGILWDRLEIGIDIDVPDLCQTGVGSFDRLTPTQKLAMLALIGRAMTTEDLAAPELTSVSEGTVAAVCTLLRDEARSEVVTAGLPAARRTAEDLERSTFWRERLCAAYLEVKALMAAGPEGDEAEVWAGADADDPPFDLPEVTSPDEDVWGMMIDVLNDAVLWDTDYDTDEFFLDALPEVRALDMEFLGIDEDYFKGIAPDPTDQELGEVRRELRELCGRS
jgi:hypothetical protein